MTADRQHQTWLLLASLLDYLPTVRVASGQLAAAANPSARAGRLPCARCAGTGRVSGEGSGARPCRSCQAHAPLGHGCRPCLACDGVGSRPARRGEAGEDAYVGRGTSTPAVASVRAMSLREIDRELDRLEQDAAARAGRSAGVTAQERNRRVQHRFGSYAEVEQALDWLRNTAPRRYSLVWSVVVCQEPVELGPNAQTALEETITQLSRLLPDPIRVPWWLERDPKVEALRRAVGRAAADVAQGQRNDAMRRQAGEGWSARRIGEFWGVSDRRVRQILAGPVATTAA